MEKLILADNTELEIRPGASLGAITAEVENFAGLETVYNALTKTGNLDSVKFKSGENVTGEYSDMKLESPVFRSVDVVDGKVQATISIREKTEMEKAIDEIRAQQATQDGAILDLAGMMGGE